MHLKWCFEGIWTYNYTNIYKETVYVCMYVYIPYPDTHRKCLEGTTHSRLLTVTTSEERFFFLAKDKEDWILVLYNSMLI